MNPDLIGEQIRLEAGTAGTLVPLATTAVTAFAQAAGGAPASVEDLDAEGLGALEAAGAAERSVLVLTVAESGIELRSSDDGEAPPLLIWPA